MSEAAKLTVLSPDPDAPEFPSGEEMSGVEETPECSDLLLLDAWKTHRDAEAFGALVSRYSGLVIGVCRRQCRTNEDAEDAFQATFMILARDSGKIRDASVLPAWLHRVAYRTSCRARSRLENTESMVHEPIEQNDPLENIARRHRLRALDEELSQLSDEYRSAIVLHFLEGHTCQQTADSLGTTEPAIRGRLQRAKKELQRRLMRRGIALSATLAALAVSSEQQVAASELILKTTTLAVDPSMTSAARVDLSPLLAKESIMLSKLSMSGIIAAGVLGLAGFALAQGSLPRGSGEVRSEKVLVLEEGNSRAGQADTVVATQFADGGSEGFAGEAMEGFGGDGMEMMGGEPRFQRAGSKWLTANENAMVKIEKQLTEMHSMNLVDEPLETAVRDIADEQGVQIHIDRRALDDIGLATDQPVNMTVKDVTLESALQLMLRDLDLTFTIEDEVLKITTIEEAEARPMTRVYWASETGLQLDDAAIKLIQNTISPDTWQVLGGPSTIGAMTTDDESQSALVISTSFSVHREIGRLLKAIEEGSASKLRAADKPPAPANVGGGGMF